MIDYKKDLFEFIDTNSLQTNKEITEFYNKINRAGKICLFGASLNGQSLAYYLNSNKIKVDCFCDNNSMLWDKNICLNIPCISPEKLQNIYNDNVFIIISSRYYKEIEKQINLLGFTNYFIIPHSLYLKVKNYLLTNDKNNFKKIISNLIDVLDDESSRIILIKTIKNWFSPINDFIEEKNWEQTKGVQYFPHDIIKLKKDEVFIDVGAFDGDTIASFLKESYRKFDRIFAYELDKNNYLKLLNNINQYDPEIKNRIISYNQGLMNENKTIHYLSGSTTESCIIDGEANETGNVVKLSDHLKNVFPTYIKMDIEGAELEALKGAEETIKKCKPKLAVCVYHNPEHIWQIPFYIKKMLPDYKIYFRHHSNNIIETVCYAVI